MSEVDTLLRAEHAAQDSRRNAVKENLIACLFFFIVSAVILVLVPVDEVRCLAFTMLVGVAASAHILRHEYRADTLAYQCRVQELLSRPPGDNTEHKDGSHST